MADYKLELQQNGICSSGENKYELCLICSSKVEISPVQKDSKQLLRKSLTVVFILRSLLKVPSSKLENNLKSCGNPNNWIKLCDQCTELTKQAEKLYCQITKNSRELSSIQKKIINKIRTLPSNPKDTLRSTSNSKTIEVARNIRNFVKNYGYIEQASNTDNPFIEGDKLAKYLVTPTISPVTTEMDTQLDNDHENNVCHDDWHDDNTFPDIDDHNEEFKTDDKFNSDKINTMMTNVKSARAPVRVRSSKKLSLSSGSKRPYQKMINVNGKWKCRHCDKLFLSSSSCNVHERKIHYSNPSDQYICDICGKALIDSSSLLVHRRNVHKIRLDGTQTIRKPKKKYPRRKMYPGTCTLCGKHFQDRLFLKNHVKFVHEKHVEHVCNICGVTTFPRKFDLKRHQLTVHKDHPTIKDLIEEGVKIWGCKVKGCRAQFIKKRNLDKHTESIHKDKDANGRYACSFCGRGFWEMHNLKNHELVHRNVNEGNNPFCCEECGLGFPSPGYLNNHKQRVHKPGRK